MIEETAELRARAITYEEKGTANSNVLYMK
jgi:hypothetical protein